MRYFDADNKPYVLGAELAKGGEAILYTVPNSTSLIGKIYRPTANSQSMALRRQKLLQMIDKPVVGDSDFATAWPHKLLFDDAGIFVGYLMPKVGKSVELVQVYNPKSRKRQFPRWNDIDICLTAAANVCACVDKVHQAGYVIGDVNSKNFLIDQQGKVTIVDCDSFQVPNTKNPAAPFLCTVAMPEYVAPEIYRDPQWDNASSPRSIHQDCFALGVLVFQLLMFGRHPFSGIWQRSASDAPSVSEKISQGLYIFNSGQGYNTPPSYLSLTRVTTQLAQLFTRCFVDGHRDPKARPHAREWIQELRSANRTNERFRSLLRALNSNDDVAIAKAFSPEMRSDSRLSSSNLQRVDLAIGNMLKKLNQAITAQDSATVESIWILIKHLPAAATYSNRATAILSELNNLRSITLSLAVASRNANWIKWAYSRIGDKEDAVSRLTSHERVVVERAINSN